MRKVSILRPNAVHIHKLCIGKTSLNIAPKWKQKPKLKFKICMVSHRVSFTSKVIKYNLFTSIQLPKNFIFSTTCCCKLEGRAWLFITIDNNWTLSQQGFEYSFSFIPINCFYTNKQEHFKNNRGCNVQKKINNNKNKKSTGPYLKMFINTL